MNHLFSDLTLLGIDVYTSIFNLHPEVHLQIKKLFINDMWYLGIYEVSDDVTQLKRKVAPKEYQTEKQKSLIF